MSDREKGKARVIEDPSSETRKDNYSPRSVETEKDPSPTLPGYSGPQSKKRNGSPP